MTMSNSTRRVRRTAPVLLGVVAAFALVSGCGGASSSAPAGGPAPAASGAAANPNAPEVIAAGDIPDNQAFVGVTSPEGFTFSVPEGWAKTVNGPATTFTDKLNSIKVESKSGASQPTTASAQAAVAALGAQHSGFVPGKTSTVSRAGGQAILVTYQLDSKANGVTGKTVHEAVEQYQFFRNGQLVTFTLSAPAGSDNVDPWLKVTDSFRWAR